MRVVDVRWHVCSDDYSKVCGFDIVLEADEGMVLDQLCIVFYDGQGRVIADRCLTNVAVDGTGPPFRKELTDEIFTQPGPDEKTIIEVDAAAVSKVGVVAVRAQ